MEAQTRRLGLCLRGGGRPGSPRDIVSFDRETVPVSHVEWRSRPQVHRPVMVCAFSGWNDGGEAASTAARYLREELGATRFARVDPEEFFDFQVNRPTVRLVEGVTRRIDWPVNDFAVAHSGGRDLVVFSGTEPNVRWRTYCEALLEVAQSLEAELLVTLGAFLADVPHTIAPPIAVASADPVWLERPGVVPAQYEGPTGIVGVLSDSLGTISPELPVCRPSRCGGRRHTTSRRTRTRGCRSRCSSSSATSSTSSSIPDAWKGPRVRGSSR